MNYFKVFTKYIALILMSFVFTIQIYSQIEWQRYVNNPIFDIGESGSWDCCGVGFTSVIKGYRSYETWYVGMDSVGVGKIGYATSSDGLTWVRYQNNPVLEPGTTGEWDANNVDYACVLKINGTYKMWYKGEDDQSSRIGYATSSDGIHWEKYNGNPVLDLGNAGSWDDHEVLHPAVVYDGNIYHMWYNGYGQDLQRTGYATSPDGITWTKYSGNPVMTIGNPGLWDDYMLALMSVIYKDNEFKMWYTAGDGTDEDVKYFRIGYATSPNGINWTKYENNPVLDLGAEGSWDNLNVAVSAVIFDTTQNIYKLWYGGMDSIYFRVGYATSSPATDVSDKYNSLPANFKLEQNYPNPFNPSTIIKYSIPLVETGYIPSVKLRVYDILGREIATLVNEEQKPGDYEVEFNAVKIHRDASLPSGIYFYKLTIDHYAATKKLILLK